MPQSTPVPAQDGRDAAISVTVVDDDRGMRTALVALLSDCGFSVLGAASSGTSAVAQALALRPSVVLMDLRMDDMDGLEATRRIRFAMPDVQVVVLSAYDDKSLRAEAGAAGAVCYLLKGAPAAQIALGIVAAAQGATQAEFGADVVGR